MNDFHFQDATCHLYVRTLPQLKALRDYFEQNHGNHVRRIYVYADLVFVSPEVLNVCARLKALLPEVQWVLALPEILREKDGTYCVAVRDFLNANPMFSGVLTGSLEGLGYFSEGDAGLSVYGDHSLYVWNREAAAFFDKMLSGACLPLELRGQEQRELLENCRDLMHLGTAGERELPWEKMTYGRIPMMLTANCIAKTAGNCRLTSGEGITSDRRAGRETDVTWLRDRLGKEFPVGLNCLHCFNVIYNTLPLSLHGQLEKWKKLVALRLQFTIESYEEVLKVLAFYFEDGGRDGKIPFGEFTTGHEKRGVQ